MTLAQSALQAEEAFATCSGWEARARLLMQWSERLEPLDDSERTDAHRIHGCESRVWLAATQRDGRLHFRADSEARLLRGLLALLLVRVEGLSSKELLNLDLDDWFARLGLQKQLSPSRSNGLNAVLQRMRELAQTT
ncbi:SufE family protein [Pseudomonas sp. NCCP-436]|uniref:SufE family protein n=1 Tax=Pseudomonas sp. NCCP-436 TaxID=2842481 RepID=UPI001C81363E|nr:SufE family protein [Pseudomonas sp. NCCP-436]GIZ11330.1 hypothetical protein NCCP436_07460 [Pseudomonas sp. NCCP-436]